MRSREFVKEDASAGATSSGSMSVVEQPLGQVISRVNIGKPAKYSNAYVRSAPKRNVKNDSR
jgi:hypothetical protein